MCYQCAVDHTHCSTYLSETLSPINHIGEQVSCNKVNLERLSISVRYNL